MKNLFASLLIFGWFFSVQFPDGRVPGVMTDVTFGPILTKELCQAMLADTLDALTLAGVSTEVTKKCFYKQEV